MSIFIKDSNYELKWNLKEDFIERNLDKIRENLSTFSKEQKDRAKILSSNIGIASKDLVSGKVFKDDKSLNNFKDTLLDISKIIGGTTLFVLPGGTIGIFAIRKLLKVQNVKALGINKLFLLSFETIEKTIENVNKEC